MNDLLIDNLFLPYLEFVVIIAIGIFVLIFIILLFRYTKFKSSNYRNDSGNTFLKTIFNTGNNGEYLTYTELERLKGYNKLLTNIYVPKKEKTTTEIDLLMISETGIYVFESKNYSGWIYGDESQKNWTQTLENKKKNKFFNPIWQNKGHINALKGVLELEDEDIYISYIIFSKRCTLKKVNVISENVKVINRDNLLRVIRKEISESKTVLNKEQIDIIYNKLSQYSLADDGIKKAHVENIKGNRG